MKPCECGCGEEIPDIDKWWNKRHYKRGHEQIGRNKTQKEIDNISGANNHKWKYTDDLDVSTLHQWLRRHWPEPIPTECSICNLEKRLELCNISPIYNTETYNREFKNWWWGCYKCHMISDGRINKNKKGV